MNIPTNSPWGRPQQIDTISDGLYFVYTAGHGGYMIHRDLAKQILPPEVLAFEDSFAGRPCNDFLCYEEDCAFAVLEQALFIMDLAQQFNQAMSEEIISRPVVLDDFLRYVKAQSPDLNERIKMIEATIKHFYPNLQYKVAA